jgi:hypothetical protein
MTALRRPNGPGGRANAVPPNAQQHHKDPPAAPPASAAPPTVQPRDQSFSDFLGITAPSLLPAASIASTSTA